MIDHWTSQTIKVNNSRKVESFYGVVISSSEENKTATKVRVLFFPQGKIDTVAKSRLDFAGAPTDINQADLKFLEQFKTI